MRLANLDNEIFFKKVFTDPEVFRAFVKDITGVDVPDARIETEKQLEQRVTAIRCRMDMARKEREFEIARNMTRAGLDTALIVQMTGVPESDIEAL